MESVLGLSSYNPGQNILGHLRKWGTKPHSAKWTHILTLKKAWEYCYKSVFLLSPSPPSSVGWVDTSTLHQRGRRGGGGNGKCLILVSYCICVPRVLTRVLVYKYSIKQTPWNVLYFERKVLKANKLHCMTSPCVITPLSLLQCCLLYIIRGTQPQFLPKYITNTF